jgi:hypothetical protein
MKHAAAPERRCHGVGRQTITFLECFLKVMELWQGLTSGTRNHHITRISKNRTVAGIRYSRGAAREAIATSVKVAGKCRSDVKAKELDSPLVRVW